MIEPTVFGDYIFSKVTKGQNLHIQEFKATLEFFAISVDCLIGLGSVNGYSSRRVLFNFLKKKGANYA